MYVCICNKVTDRAIEQAVATGIETMEGLSKELKVALCCGRCMACAEDVLQRCLEENRCLPPRTGPLASGLDLTMAAPA